MSSFFEGEGRNLPKFLTEEGQDALREELSRFPLGMNFYLRKGIEGPLQGDIFDKKHFVITDHSGAPGASKRRVMVVSNSCDIDPENKRDTPMGVLVAPMMTVRNWAHLLATKGRSKESIDGKVKAAGEQLISHMLFIPAGAGIEEDSLVLLDLIQSVRVDLLSLSEGRIGTLSDKAFYLLLLKLSFHLSRAKEGVDRTEEVAA